jgi:DNA repair photolyase
VKALRSGPDDRKSITSGTREWADHNVNCFKGCFNDCRYCYARMMAKRFGRCTDRTWKEMQLNENVVKKTFGKYRGRVMFPSSHDIVDIPEVKEACFQVIHSLLRAENELLITTKPNLSVTKDIVERFRSFKGQIQFRFTITSLDDGLLSFWEPNAPLFEERLESLRYAYEKDYKTSVSIEPFLDYDPAKLVHMLSRYITESVWLGPMNYISRNGVAREYAQQYAEIRKKCEVGHLREIFEELKDLPQIRFKDSMFIRLAAARTTECEPAVEFVG